MKEYDLGREMPDLPMTAPEPPDEDEDDKKIYPSLYLDDCPKDLLSMQDEGTATIKYEIEERAESEKNGCRIQLKVLSLKPNQTAKMASDEENDTSKAIDDYMSEKDDGE